MCHTTSEVFCLGFPFVFATYCLTNYYIQFCKIVSNHKSTFSSYADFLTYKTAQGYKSKLGILQGVQKTRLCFVCWYFDQDIPSSNFKLKENVFHKRFQWFFDLLPVNNVLGLDTDISRSIAFN